MNPDWLLTYFEQISEAPDAVPRLRRFILDLAVRGKLVEQDPADKPASELLKRIEAEKDRLTKAVELRKHHIQPLDEEQITFTIPSAWSWTHLGQIGIINPQNDNEDNAEASFVPMRMIYAEYRQPSEHEIRPWGEIKRGFIHFADGDVGLAKITPCFENGKSTVFRNLTGGIGAGTTELHIVRPIFVVADYILIFLKSSHFIEAGIPKMTGTAGQKRVPKDYFAFSPFPLPPLAEQHRIVAKVDELMVLCDELESAQAKRERQRDRLVAATLHGLNNGGDSSEPGGHPTFEESARFCFNHLPRLTTRPEHIQQLRQTILNLAVRGKLVPQDPKEEPAAELLTRVDGWWAEAIRRKLIRVPRKPLKEIDPRETPYLLPDGWAWTRLGKVIYIQSGDGLTAANMKHGDIPVYGGNGVNGFHDAFNVMEPTIVIGRVGYYCGSVHVTTERAWVTDNAFITKFCSHEIFLEFLVLLLRNTNLKESENATAQPVISGSKIYPIVFGIPPLAEQHRIVEKVDKLMVLCDELEARTTTIAATRRQLLEATLSEVIAAQ